MVTMVSDKYNMMLMADHCQLIIKSPNGMLFIDTFEFAHARSKFTENGTIMEFMYHKTLWDDYGNPIGRSEELTFCALRITEINPDAIQETGKEILPEGPVVFVQTNSSNPLRQTP